MFLVYGGYLLNQTQLHTNRSGPDSTCRFLGQLSTAGSSRLPTFFLHMFHNIRKQHINKLSDGQHCSLRNNI